MASRWNEKQRLKEEFAVNKMLDTGGDSIDFEGTMAKDVRGAAMGEGDEELFEKKLTKEEKKALAKAKREAKKKVCVLFYWNFCMFSTLNYVTHGLSNVKMSSNT